MKHVAEGDPVENMAHTAKVLNINRTTLLRLLHTLEAEGFLERKESGVGYRVGLALLSIAARSFFSQDLVEVSLPLVTRLAKETELSSHLAVLDGTNVLYMLRKAPDVPITSNVVAGTRLPAHATTTGRIMLAYMESQKIKTLYKGVTMERFSSATPRNVKELLAILDTDRRQGIAWSDSYFESGVSSAAVALRNFAGEPVGALNVSGPSDAFSPKSKRSQIETMLKQAGKEISQRLGWIER